MIFKIANASILEANLTSTANWKTGNVAPSYVKAEEGAWDYDKRDGMLYVAVRAVSVGTNGNGDHFTEEELHKAYKTFIGKGVFVNHASNDVEKMRGKIVDARWVDAGSAEKYVVCLLEMNEMAHQEFCRMIRSGQVQNVSMGAVYDTGLDHYVTMADLSLKSFFDVQIGDKVITHDGSVSEVTSRGKEWHENRSSYTIKAMKTMPVSLSEDHPLFILRKENKLISNAGQFIEAKNIHKGDYLLSNIYSKIIPSNISIKEAKLLGWYLAEGCLCDKTGVMLTLNINDPIDEIASLISFIDPEATLHNRKHTASNQAITLVFYSEKISNLIKSNIKGKAINKILSNTILNMEPEKQLALIGSYIDGDGCLASNKSTKNSAISIATSSVTLTQQIPMMLERSGILASIHTINRKPGKNSVVIKPFIQHTMYIGGSFIAPLRKYSKKAATVAKSKQNSSRCFVYENYVAVPVMSVEKKSYTGWAYNITISSDENINFNGNHSYHLNGIASHNCFVAFSECSICHHAAKTIKDYCVHVKMHKGGAYNGLPVYEINRNIEFIECSFVSTGADAQARVLEIYARKNGLDFQDVLAKHEAGLIDIDSIENDKYTVSISQAVLNGIRRAASRGSK